MIEITDEMVEAAAQAIWNSPPLREGRVAWAQFDAQASRGTDKLRRQARAALEAAFALLPAAPLGFCTRTKNCRFADGHNGGCERS